MSTCCSGGNGTNQTWDPPLKPSKQWSPGYGLPKCWTGSPAPPNCGAQLKALPAQRVTSDINQRWGMPRSLPDCKAQPIPTQLWGTARGSVWPTKPSLYLFLDVELSQWNHRVREHNLRPLLTSSDCRAQPMALPNRRIQPAAQTAREHSLQTCSPRGDCGAQLRAPPDCRI